MSRQILTPIPNLDNLFIIQITISFMILVVSLMNNMNKNYLHKIILSLTQLSYRPVATTWEEAKINIQNLYSSRPTMSVRAVYSKFST